MAGAPIDIRLTRGLDAQNDPRTVEQPYLLQAENVYFDRDAGPRKRPGYGLITAARTSASGALTNLAATSLVGHQNELLAFDDANAHAYADTMGAWVQRGTFVPTTVTQRPVSPSAINQVWCDAAVYGNAWEISVFQNLLDDSSVYFSIRDRLSGGLIRSNELAATAPGGAVAYPRVVRTLTGFLILYQGSDGTYARSVGTNPMSSTLIGAAVKVTSATGYVDAIFDGQYTLVTVYSASTVVQVFALDASGNAVITRTLASVPSGTPMAVNLASFNGNASAAANVGKVIVTYGNALSGMGQTFLDVVTGNLLTAASSVTLASNDFVKQISVVNRYNASSLGETITLYSTVQSTGAFPQFATYYSTGSALSATGSAVMGNNVLASRPFWYNGAPYAFVARASSLIAAQATTYAYGQISSPQGVAMLVNIYTGVVVASMGYGVTVGADTVPATPIISGTTVEVPIAKVVKLTAAPLGTRFNSVNYYFFYGVRFVTSNQVQSAQLGEMRVFSGGVNRFYDGASVVEQGFLVTPEIFYFGGGSLGPPPAGGTPAGFYQAYAIYEWTDRLGNLHRSAPSPIASFTQATASSGGLALTVSQYVGTLKPNVVIAVYITKANGTIFYRTTTMPGNFTSPTGATSGNQFAAPQGSVASEIIYTTGGILPNDPWPPSAIMTTSRNRIFVAGGDDADVVQYTKAYVKGDGMAMPLALSKRISSVPGPITALAAMDDKVVVFKQRSILFFYGQNGPNTDGSNDDFSSAQILTTEIGCISKNSIVVTAEGTYFQSEKGIYLLSRAMGLSFVGQPVAALTQSATITSATLTPKQTAIRFGTQTGQTFVYHYRLVGQYGDSLQCGQWTTFSNYQQYQASLYRGAYVFARADGRVCLEADGTYLDDTQPVVMRLRTAWLRVGALMQAGAWTDLAVLGMYQSPHQLRVAVYRDYRAGVDTVLRYDTRIGIATTTWGSSTAWGTQATFGGDADDTYTARWRLVNGNSSVATLSLSIHDAGLPSAALAGSCQILGINLLGNAQNELARLGDKKRQ